MQSINKEGVNLKNQEAAKKLPLHLVPPALIEETAKAFADGAKKYTPYNWREGGASVSVYYGALLRHIFAYWNGEEISADARVSHLAHAAACIAILLDTQKYGSLEDDRPPAILDKEPPFESSSKKEGTVRALNDYQEDIVQALNDYHDLKIETNWSNKDNILNGGDT